VDWAFGYMRNRYGYSFTRDPAWYGDPSLPARESAGAAEEVFVTPPGLVYGEHDELLFGNCFDRGCELKHRHCHLTAVHRADGTTEAF
jgi:hypothetical protein